MESSSSSSSSSPSSTPPRCKKPKRATNSDPIVPAKDIVAALHHTLVQSSDCVDLLTNLRRLLSLLHSPLTSASPAQALCASGFLDLLPPLLSHSSSKVGKKSAEAVGLLAIASYEVSCHLAEKQEVLTALAQLLQRPKSDVFLIAIHSILNVATSEFGCAALGKVAGLPQQLLRLVSFLADTLTEMLKAGDIETLGELQKYVGTGESIKECALSHVNTGSHQMPKEGDLDFLLNIPLEETAELFNLALAAVNTIFQGFGPVEFFRRSDVLGSLRSLWQSIFQLQSYGVSSDAHKLGPAAEFLRAPNRRAQLAKLIMRLAMQDSVDVDANAFDARRLFGNVEHFFQQHWELSPARMTTAFEQPGLSRFMEKIAGSGPARLLALLVDGMVACPPAVADELDPAVLYKDMEHDLGLLPVLNQDIRLLKCNAGVEIPYPIESETSSVSSRDCIEAYASGNTVVVRGLQFRWPEISVISSGLAAELGQVTVGANLYLTPPGSQGLGVHFDDHCVFVCQLRGHKRWSVYPPLEELPRLYSFKTLATEVKKECATHYDLQEGDLLYIPRGFLHEARTVSVEEDVKVGFAANNLASCSECCYDESPCDRTSFTDENDGHSSRSNTSAWHGASLHLSFGVEVEPAFEWEGLLHIALRLWSHRSLQNATPGLNTNSSNLYEISEILLHVAIRNVGSSSQLFRKACILRNTCKNQNPMNADAERMFHFMLNEVGESADCHSAVECYYREGVAWLDWLRHMSGGHHFNTDLGVLESCTEALHSAFQNVRDRFCQEVSFLESIAAQDALLCNFRNSRQKVMNGLLALHCGCDV